jgi:hypothetical protein
MVFETNKDVLEWYEKQTRTLTPEFISAIPWDQVKNYPLNDRFIPVLLYMRDVETLTDMYHREMLWTPTGKDPYISKFMERWGLEERTHGEVLDRFLNEAGFETGDKWRENLRRSVSKAYVANTYLTALLARLIGKKFTATHMTFGAVHEMSTAQGYRQLAKLAGHPVLTHLLNGIIREEAAHTQFYWNVARLELAKNKVSQKMTRFIIEHFWRPVGQGSVPKHRTELMIGTLFGDKPSLKTLDKKVTRRVQQLPGFDDLTMITETIGRMAENAAMQLTTV